MTDGSKVDHMLNAGSNPSRTGGLRGGDQASAADPADHPAADAGAGAVAGSVNKCGLVNHIRDAAIIRTNQNDSVVAFLHKKQMGPGLRHFFPGQGWQLG